MNRLLQIFRVGRQIVTVAAILLLAASLTAEAQSVSMHRIGMLETIPPALNAANLDAFRQGLRELGYIEGQTLIIEYRSADGREERFPSLAKELVRLKVDLIVTRGTPATQAAKDAAGTIPVVAANAGDLVGSGLVASLARPGGNVTGLTAVTTALEAKRLELLRELVPRLSRIAGLYNMHDPRTRLGWKEIEAASRSFGIEPQLLDVREAYDIGPAFHAAVRQRADALIVAASSLTQANRQVIADLAMKHRLPAMYPYREFVDAGGLVSYGANVPDMYRRASYFVDKILKGAKPADLPVEQPTKFELVINMRTAKGLGLTISPSVMLRADQVIE